MKVIPNHWLLWCELYKITEVQLWIVLLLK